jgi:hypothetical protein
MKIGKEEDACGYNTKEEIEIVFVVEHTRYSKNWDERIQENVINNTTHLSMYADVESATKQMEHMMRFQASEYSDLGEYFRVRDYAYSEFECNASNKQVRQLKSALHKHHLIGHGDEPDIIKLWREHQDDGNYESKLHFRTGGNDTQIIVPPNTNALKITTETTSDALVLSMSGYLTLQDGISATNTSFSGTMNIAGGIYHIGDTDTFFGFIGGNDTFGITTGGGSRMDANNAGVRFGGSGARIGSVLDEDNMASDSATALATQQSIKAYVDASTTGVLTYQGTWNADTNSPTLSSGSGTPGYYYIVSVAGSTNLDGITDWAVGDWAVFSDQATDAWQKIDNTAVGNVSG